MKKYKRKWHNGHQKKFWSQKIKEEIGYGRRHGHTWRGTLCITGRKHSGQRGKDKLKESRKLHTA